MDIICSKENKLIKYCRKLASDKDFRKDENKIFIEGYRLSFDAYLSGVKIEYLLVTQQALDKWEKLADMLDYPGQVFLVDPKVSKFLGETTNTQGVFAVCEIPTAKDMEFSGRYVFLDTVQDPGNLGTIIRSCDAFGVSGIFMSVGCADVWSGKVLRSAMGSVFRQNIYTNVDLVDRIDAVIKSGGSVFSAMLDDSAVTVMDINRSGSCIGVVLGNEGNGVSPQVAEICSESVYIPMRDGIESLNVATAGTIFIWEMCKGGIT